MFDYEFVTVNSIFVSTCILNDVIEANFSLQQ